MPKCTEWMRFGKTYGRDFDLYVGIIIGGKIYISIQKGDVNDIVEDPECDHISFGCAITLTI